MTSPHQHTPGMPALKGGDGSGPGWDAITAAAARAHPGQRPVLLQAMNDARASGIGAGAPRTGTEALDAVAAYRAMEPFSHWHYIGYGLTDLYSEGSAADDGSALGGYDGQRPAREPSGLGFELTFRLADPGAFDPGSHPPMWPMELLQKLARWALAHERPVVPGDILDLGAPIDGDATTALVGLLAITDPTLAHIDAPAGHVDFVQLVGATAQDLADAKAWHVQGLLDLFGEVMGLGLTDVTRPSVRNLPGFQQRVEAGIARAQAVRG